MVTDNTEMRHFTVREYPTIVVDNDFGRIHVRGAQQSNEVSIQATKRNWILIGGESAPARIHYEQNNDENSITVTVERVGWSVTETDLDITVPWNANLKLTTKAGSIDVAGVSSQMFAQSNAGSITVRQSTLGGSSTLQTTAGSVHFDGAIDPHATCQFVSNTGSVHVILPPDAAYHIDARTDIGSITTNIPGLLVTRLNYMSSDAHCDVGEPPRAMITLISNLGSISLQQRT